MSTPRQAPKKRDDEQIMAAPGKAPYNPCTIDTLRHEQAPERLRQEWCTATELSRWEVTVEGGRLRCDERRPRMDPEKCILYPELIYRRSQGDAWVEEAVLKIPRRCYTPEAFEQAILRHGFQIVQRWGGYAGEPYGKGPELVIEFRPG